MQITGRVVTPNGVIEHGWVSVHGDRISGVGDGRPGSGAAARRTDEWVSPWVVPGFVDIHAHGGGGYDFTTGEAEAARGAAAFHLSHGTTTILASLVASPVGLMREATATLAPLVRQGVLGGIHYEGPYLSSARCGAQNPEFLRPVAPSEVAALLTIGGDAVRMVTLAPELTGALELIRWLASRGVVAAVGHTDASYATTIAAVRAGATVGTHLFNGMRPPQHREPGPVYALLGASGVVCELIADGVHLHDGTLAFAASAAPGRIALVTDAMAAAGMPDGEYALGGQSVIVADRVARLARDGSIAGSTLTMDAAFRRAVGAGLSMTAVCQATSTTPAIAIGQGGEVGALVSGHRADLVLLDEDLGVTAVLRAGRWVR